MPLSGDKSTETSEQTGCQVHIEGFIQSPDETCYYSSSDEVHTMEYDRYNNLKLGPPIRPQLRHSRKGRPRFKHSKPEGVKLAQEYLSIEVQYCFIIF